VTSYTLTVMSATVTVMSLVVIVMSATVTVMSLVVIVIVTSIADAEQGGNDAITNVQIVIYNIFTVLKN